MYDVFEENPHKDNVQNAHAWTKQVATYLLFGSSFSQRFSGPLPRSPPASMAPRCAEVNVHPTTMSCLGRHASHDIGHYGAPAHLGAISHSVKTTPHISTSPLPAAVEQPTVGHPTGTTCSCANLHSTARGRFVAKAGHTVFVSQKSTCDRRSPVSFSTIGAISQAPMWVPFSPFLFLSLSIYSFFLYLLSFILFS